MKNEIVITGRKLTYSKSTIARNPGLLSLGGLRAQVAQPHARRALDPKAPRAKAGSAVLAGGPLYRVTFVTCLARAVDSDNFGSASFKGLRDSIASWLGLDDDDRLIAWEYPPPLVTHGARGTMVRIEVLR